MKILTRYILREMIPPTALGLAFYTMIILMQSLFSWAGMIIQQSLSIGTVGRMLLLSLPNIVVLTVPMSLLSGTFYVISNLSPVFQSISRANPFFYLISGFRFGFLGQSDIGNTNHAVIGAAVGTGVLNLVLGVISYRLLKSGWKLKS